MVLSYYYLETFRNGLLLAHHDRFFFVNYVGLERSPLDEAKKSIKPLNKWKCQKCVMGNCNLQSDPKRPTAKTTLTFFRFFQTISDINYGKNCY